MHINSHPLFELVSHQKLTLEIERLVGVWKWVRSWILYEEDLISGSFRTFHESDDQLAWD